MTLAHPLTGGHEEQESLSQEDKGGWRCHQPAVCGCICEHLGPSGETLSILVPSFLFFPEGK